jgi:N-acetylmuramoyl-L-alanine amidase
VVWIGDIKLKNIRRREYRVGMSKRLLHFMVISLVLVMAPAVWAQAAATAVTAMSIETGENGSELLKFDTNGPVEVRKAFALSAPNRVVVDIPRVASGVISLPKVYVGQLVKSVRFGQFDAKTSRIVLDLNGPAKVEEIISGSPFMVQIIGTGPIKPKGKGLDAKPLIIIDAGHGGQDPGAIGLHGTREKDVTLNYARQLREALLRTGRYRVALTREDDRFIMLQDRVGIARKLKGDIFLSFHADSNPRAEARGLSIYTLSENASDDEAAALAEHENKADIIPGIDLSKTDADVASILIDLTQRETMNKSANFADAVVDSLHGKITKLQKTHRFAGFRVLKAPDIPSTLVELGFLSNETDERLLLSPEYRDLVITSIVKGIDRFRAGE